VPWNSNFDATALNYTPGVLRLGLIVGVWWLVSAKNKYTGPVRTIDEIGEAPAPPPAPAPAAGGSE
jgi:hypothetical protein